MLGINSITLVNPISGRGHLDAYARLYSRAFLELGWKVVLFAETDGDTANYVTRTSPQNAPLFSFVPSKAAPSPDGSANPGGTSASDVASRTRLVWQKQGAAEVARRILARVLGRSASLLPGPVRRQADRLKQAIARSALRTPPKSALPSDADLGRIPFKSLVDGVRRQPKSDLVFFLYLDLMVEQPQNISCLDRDDTPWIGILFHPRLARDLDGKVEGYFSSHQARGGLFLVPAALPAYAKATPHLAFALAPDVADLELPADLPAVAREMRQRAGNRKIVLQIGSIAAHKGISALLDVIELADASEFFFAVIGEVHWGTFETHKERIQAFYACPPENVFVFEGYIGNERDYNGIIQASDIIYAVYQDFNSSSNSLTKASGLRRPILVSEPSLIGDRVRHFDIGETSPQGDAKQILQRLRSLATRRCSFGFDHFNEEHSLETLKAVLAKAIPFWLRAIDPVATSRVL